MRSELAKLILLCPVVLLFCAFVNKNIDVLSWLYFYMAFTFFFYLRIKVQFLVSDWVFIIEDDLFRYVVCVFLCCNRECSLFFFSQTKTFL